MFLKNKVLLFGLIFLFILPSLFSQELKTYAFAERDTCTLFMDVYQPAQQREDK